MFKRNMLFRNLISYRSDCGAASEATDNYESIAGVLGQKRQRLIVRVMGFILKSYKPKCKDSIKKNKKCPQLLTKSWRDQLYASKSMGGTILIGCGK